MKTLRTYLSFHYLFLIVLFYVLPLYPKFTQHKDVFVFILLLTPLVVLAISVNYYRHHHPTIQFPIICTLLHYASIFIFYNDSAIIYTVMIFCFTLATSICKYFYIRYIHPQLNK